MKLLPHLHLGIREKLLIAFFVVISVILSISGSIFFQSSQQVLTDEIYEKLQIQGQSISIQIQDRLDTYLEIAKQIGSRLQLRQLLLVINQGNTDIEQARNGIQNILLGAYSSSKSLNNIKMYSPEQMLIVSSPSDSSVTEKDRILLEALSRQSSPVWSWPDRLNENLKIGMPLELNSILVAYAIIDFQTDDLALLINSLALEADAYEIILSRQREDGRVVAMHTTRNLNPVNISLEFDSINVDGEFAMLDNDTDYRGNTVIGILSPIRDYPLGVTTKVDSSILLQSVNDQASLFILLALSSLLLAVLIVFILSTLLTKPIIDMTRIASMIVSGDMEKRINKVSEDEIGQLAIVLNQMADKLQFMKNELETRITRQNEELKYMNEALIETNEELIDLSGADPLTGIANRRTLEVHLSREWRRARRSEQPLSFCMIDIDLFKLYNDTFGHDAGDKALIDVAHILKDACRRPADLCARYGGEEFCVLLPDTEANNVLYIANEICQKIHDAKIPHPASTVSEYLTVSIGVASMVPTDKVDMEDLINLADKFLYKAKAAGRNQVCSENS